MEYAKSRVKVSPDNVLGLVRVSALIVLVSVLLGDRSRGQTPTGWMGVEVILKPGVKAPGTQARSAPTPFLRYRVERIEDDRLWIRSGTDGGWVQAGDLIPFAQALHFYTNAIRADPGAAWAYARRALIWYDKDELDIAIADYSEALALDAQDAVTFDNRGLAWLEKKDYDRALKDFSQAHRLEPNEASFLDHRGLGHLAKGKLEQAIADFSTAIQLDPQGVAAYDHRGFARAKGGQYARAVADYEAALRLDARDVWANNALAWLRATCPVAAYRDGAKAVALATLASKTIKEEDPYLLGTLAAAEAEAGDFIAAAAWQAKALALYPDDDPDLAGHRARLALYQAKQPYHEGSPRP